MKSPILTSLRRGFTRIAALVFVGLALLVCSHLIPLALGPVLAPLAFGFGLCFAGLAVGDIALRILQPRVDAQDAASTAINTGSTGAGLVYLGRCLLAAVILQLLSTASRAAEPPAAALPLLPVLLAEQRAWAPALPPSVLAAQVEQETCITLKSRGCWSPRAELRTARERGVGLGQITKTARFDTLADLRRANPVALAGWDWASPTLYDPAQQLRGLALLDMQGWRALAGVPDDDRLAMMLSGYNGGMGGVQSDRRACAGTPGCDPARWWGNVEHTSLKAKMAVKGYGKSFFQINREYPVNILRVRRARYLSLDTAT